MGTRRSSPQRAAGAPFAVTRRFPQDRRLVRLGLGVRREAFCAVAHPSSGCGSLSVCSPSITVTRRGSRADCPARSSTAHLASYGYEHRREQQHESRHHRGRSPQVVGHDRGRRRTRETAGSGRFTTDRAGYAAMRTYARTWAERVWAIEGANGTGRPLAQRLLEAGEHVVESAPRGNLTRPPRATPGI
jgi:hypothetical protein